MEMETKLTEEQQDMFTYIDDKVTEYVKENEVSPFNDIQEKQKDGKGTGELQVDMDAEFEKELVEHFGEETSKALGIYFTEIIKLAMIEMDENEKEKEKEKDQDD
jgi:hypothetical protein